MSSEEKFAKALAESFVNPAVRKKLADLNRPSYEIGDGTEVVLGDTVAIPNFVGGSRANKWGEVIKLSDGGLGLRFQEKVAGITREFFEWEDLIGARCRRTTGTQKGVINTSSEQGAICQSSR